MKKALQKIIKSAFGIFLIVSGLYSLILSLKLFGLSPGQLYIGFFSTLGIINKLDWIIIFSLTLILAGYILYSRYR